MSACRLKLNLHILAENHQFVKGNATDHCDLLFPSVRPTPGPELVAGRVDQRVGPGRVGSGQRFEKLNFSKNKLRYFCCMNCTTRSIRIQSFTIPDVNGNRCLLPAMFSAAATCRKVITAGTSRVAEPGFVRNRSTGGLIIGYKLSSQFRPAMCFCQITAYELG